MRLLCYSENKSYNQTPLPIATKPNLRDAERTALYHRNAETWTSPLILCSKVFGLTYV